MSCDVAARGGRANEGKDSEKNYWRFSRRRERARQASEKVTESFELLWVYARSGNKDSRPLFLNGYKSPALVKHETRKKESL